MKTRRNGLELKSGGPAEGDVELRFQDYSRPHLRAGDYHMAVHQDVQIRGRAELSLDEERDALKFHVTGKRLRLDAEDIRAVYPVADACGEFSRVIPHIALIPATLPWEREAQTESGLPWLCLLVFDAAEVDAGHVRVPRAVSLKELRADRTADFPPDFALESGENETDLVNVLDVRRSFFERRLPQPQELGGFTHVRQRFSIENETALNEGIAIVAATRLVNPSGKSSVHLVSLENRFAANEFQYHSADPDSMVRLIALHSWTFESVPHSGESFPGLARALKSGALRFDVSRPDSTSGRAAAAGYVPLPHLTRAGESRYSWYRGPCVPLFSDRRALDKAFEQNHGIAAHEHFADDLIQQDPELNVWDVSYAAAWQLGRLLALADREFSLALHVWKRRANRAILEDRNNRHLGIQGDHTCLDFVQHLREDPAKKDRASVVNELLRERVAAFVRLEQVPFEYLAPRLRDASLSASSAVPDETLRFFYQDGFWIRCLLYGAFSIGGTMHGNEGERQALFDRFLAEHRPVLEPCCGFLLCSRIVDDWPDLKVRVFAEHVADETGTETMAGIDALRLARLPGSILIGLFPQKFETLEMYVAPEGLHFSAGADALAKAGLVEAQSRRLEFLAAPGRATGAAAVSAHLIERAFKGRFHWSSDA
ncbi:MAG: hypothetical protein RIF32_22630 [Leptospirales bacterium]|jgi:hypothetical protein